MDEIRYQVERSQARLTIDREQARNTLSAEGIGALMAGLSRAEADPAVRVVVLTGGGEKVFCAGADLTSFAAADSPEQARENRRAYGTLLERLQQLRKPSIARVNGHALAGGLGLMLACDLAVTAQTAQFGTPEVHVGLFPMMVMALLQRHLGRKQALELVMLGERFTATQAKEWGLVNRVAAAGQLDAEVEALAEKLADKSQAVLALGRRAFFAAEDLPLSSALDHLAGQLTENLALDDALEGVTAFVEKRPPRWTDR